MKKPVHHPSADEQEDTGRFEHQHLKKRTRHGETKSDARAAGNKISRGQEHGPAHVHVIDKASGRESKFEFIEHFEAYRHHARRIEKHRDEKKPLTPAQIEAVLPILSAHTTGFVQLWREFYQDCKLSNYVTRVSEKFPHCEESIYFGKGRDHDGRRDNKMVLLKDEHNGRETVMTFDDYVTYVQGDAIPKPKRR